MIKAEDPVVHDLKLKNNLKKGDLLQIRYGEQVLGQYICDNDPLDVTAKLILIPTSFVIENNKKEIILEMARPVIEQKTLN